MPYNRIVRILDVSDYKITCLFNTKETRVVDFGPFIKENKTNKIVNALLDKVYFLNVAIDEIGGLYWPNGFDCSANKIYDWDKKNIEDRNKEKNLV